MTKDTESGARAPSPPSPAELEELTAATMAIANLIAEGLELGATPAMPLLRVSGTILAALRKRGWELPAGFIFRDSDSSPSTAGSSSRHAARELAALEAHRDQVCPQCQGIDVTPATALPPGTFKCGSCRAIWRRAR